MLGEGVVVSRILGGLRPPVLLDLNFLGRNVVFLLLIRQLLLVEVDLSL